MPKKIGLKQLAQKKYELVQGLAPEFSDSLGQIEDAFDMLIHGASGNGKTNFTIQLIKALVKALNCRCEYVSYEEGHAKTMQDALIHRHHLMHELGNNLVLVEHYTYDELVQEMNKRRSAKIFVIDSLQASHFTAEQCAELKHRFVLSKKRKIIIYISWSEGRVPAGATARSVEYYANIKVRVEGLIAFIRSRYGGNKNYVIWEEGAKKYWGTKMFNKHKSR